ncbi:MAG TPA: OFA family MFS transporter [Rubrobacteraceae bacterium]|nr:OFA family MFS transporter [Rubrobacteraceae bacterium]
MNRWVVAGAAVVVQAGLGSYYSWSVFREPLSDLYGANITRVNVAFLLASFVFTIAAFGGGLLMRRVGPRAVGVAGGFLYGLGVFLSSFAGESLPVLYLTYGVVVGTGLGFGYIAPLAALPGWFPDRPGLAYGLAVCGFGAGSAINVPVAEALLSSTGDPLRTFGILGVAYAALIGGAAFLVRDPPLGPEGQKPAGSAAAGRSWGFRGVVRTWQWYAMLAIFCLNVSAGLAIISDAKAIAASVGGASAALASAFVVMLAVADTTGRLFWPALSDRIGQGAVFVAIFVLQAAAFALLPLVGPLSFAAFCALSFVALTCYGGGYGTMPALVNAYYGSGDVGTIYASILFASGIAGFGAPLLLALTADATGSYGPALYATAALMLVGTAIPLALRPP